MKLLITLFAVLAVVLNIIMPASGMNHCNCKPCTAPYEISAMSYTNQYYGYPQNVYG